MQVFTLHQMTNTPICYIALVLYAFIHSEILANNVTIFKSISPLPYTRMSRFPDPSVLSVCVCVCVCTYIPNLDR